MISKKVHTVKHKLILIILFLPSIQNHQLVLVGWNTMQVLKYLVRAGKKEGESYDKDHNKALDYAKELANLSNENELTEYTTDDIMGFIQELADDFERWEGIK